jgi:hypothetical protein
MDWTSSARRVSSRRLIVTSRAKASTQIVQKSRRNSIIDHRELDRAIRARSDGFSVPRANSRDHENIIAE